MDTTNTESEREEEYETFRLNETDSVVADVVQRLHETKPIRIRFSFAFSLTTEDIHKLVDALPHAIQELCFEHCQCSFMKICLTRLKSTRIQRLALTGNDIDDELIQAVGELLQADQGLRQVELKHNSLQRDGATAMANGIANHSTLQTLDLSDSMVNNAGRDALIKAMFTNNSIKVLSLAGKMFDGSPTAHGIGNMLRANKTLQDLDLQRNRISKSELLDIASALSKNRSLRWLHLAYVQADANVAIRLSQSIVSTNTTVRCIGLSGNPDIGDLGGVAMAKAITNSGLQHLDLRYTGLGKATVIAISEELSRNQTSLRSLNLSKNNIGDDGVKLIADALAVNTSLKTLSLSQCGITCEGAAYFSQKLPQMNSIEQLFMYRNKITQEGGRLLTKGLEYNMSLLEFGIERAHLISSRAPSVLYKDVMAHFLRANKIGRRILREDNIHTATWSKILEIASSADMIFYLISQKPDLIKSY